MLKRRQPEFKRKRTQTSQKGRSDFVSECGNMGFNVSESSFPVFFVAVVRGHSKRGIRDQICKLEHLLVCCKTKDKLLYPFEIIVLLTKGRDRLELILIGSGGVVYCLSETRRLAAILCVRKCPSMNAKIKNAELNYFKGPFQIQSSLSLYERKKLKLCSTLHFWQHTSQQPSLDSYIISQCWLSSLHIREIFLMLPKHWSCRLKQSPLPNEWNHFSLSSSPSIPCSYLFFWFSQSFFL